MSMSVYEKIIQEGAGFLEFVWLHFFGEPLINPDIYKMIDMAEDAGIRTGMSTNGTRLDEKASAKLLDSKLSMLYISLDGATKQTFEKIRIGAKFEKVHANVARFAEMKRARNSEMLVRLQMIHMTSTQNEREQFDEEWRDKGFDTIDYKPFHYWANQDESLIQIEEASPPTPTGACAEPWIGFAILADGTAVPCCNDYSAKIPLGDLKTQSLREVWNGPAMMKLRSRFAGEVPDVKGTLCEGCTFPVLGVQEGQAVFSASDARLDVPRWNASDMPVLSPSDPHLVNISFKSFPSRVEPGQPIACTVAVENRSPWNLRSTGPNPINISYHWIDSNGACVVFDGLRSRLIPELPSGRQRTYPLDVIAPDAPGRYTLRVTPVQEYVAWFDNIDPRNTAQCMVEVEVIASREKLERPSETVLATAL
jgi:MoaA/NifB/PqqE/SkfB family radical SAM enzyme